MMRFSELLGRLKYKDWRFVCLDRNGVALLQLQWNAPCNDTGRVCPQTSRKWFLSEHMTDSEVVQTALLAVLTAEEHEAREQFQFDEKAIFGPHFNINNLHQINEHDKRQ